MAYRIRQSVRGDIEVEVDTATEVQLLLQVVRANGGRGHAIPLLAAPEVPVVEKKGRRGRPRLRRAPRPRASGKADAAPPVSRRGPLDVAALLKILSRGPGRPAALARELGHARHKVTAALRELAEQKRVHATGATLNRLWHLGPASAAPASTAPRRGL